MRFVVPRNFAVGRSHNNEPYVQVEVLGFVGPSRNGMNIEIDRRLDDMKTIDAGFLGRLGECDPSKIGVSVCVAAGLKPTIQFHMMKYQRRPTARIHDCGRTGEVTAQAGSEQRVGMIGAEVQDLIPKPPLGLVGHLDRFDLTKGVLEAGRHRGNLSSQIHYSFGGEADFVEGGLSGDGGSEGIPQLGADRRRKFGSFAPQQPGQRREPNYFSIDDGRASLVAVGDGHGVPIGVVPGLPYGP